MVDARDRQRFVELLAEWVERFGLRLHAWVLLDNHYHLLVETPAANLSAAMQWLGVSYTMWFNHRHRRSGHLFQGRFRAMILEAETTALEVSRYIHLNPVRVRRLGLDKAAQQRSRDGFGQKPDAHQVHERLVRLRGYPWSSYRAYVGRQRPPEWLTTTTVLDKRTSNTWNRQCATACPRALGNVWRPAWCWENDDLSSGSENICEATNASNHNCDGSAPGPHGNRWWPSWSVSKGSVGRSFEIAMATGAGI